MKELKGRVAVLTGAASGFGLEVARLAAAAGMKVVMADVQAEALARAADEIRGLGAEVLAQRCDVSKAEDVEALGAATQAAFGAPNFVFNNAGVASGGLVWEHSVADWNWVLGVNLWGVIHGVRVFTPMMLAAAQADLTYEGHIVNTASMAGMASAPNMGVYNVSKHGVVTLSETLYQDLALVTDQISASVLCPYFIPTGIHLSERNRPSELAAGAETKSQMISRVMSEKAITSAKVTAAEIAAKVLAAVQARQFYVFSHPHALAPVQSRLDDILQQRNPSDPFLARPEVGVKLRAALRE